jgi:F-type H+-transporting ATPase subunit delta
VDGAPTPAAVIDGYARGLVEVAKGEGDVDGIADQIFRIASAVEASDPLRDALTDTRIPVDRKQGVIDELLGARASSVVVSAINFLVSAGHAGHLRAIAGRLAELAAAGDQQTLAEVRSAIELDGATVQRLEEKLSAATGKQVKAKVVVDPALVGGLVAKVGDTVFDGSVKSRLQDLREAWS